MTETVLIQKIQSGELPSVGILRRTGAAKDLVITQNVDGEKVVVPDVVLEIAELEEVGEEAS